MGAVLDIRTREEFRVIDGGVKLRKDGMPKKTHSNAKVGRSTFVDPIKNIEDVKAVAEYLRNKLETAPKHRWDLKKGYARNLLYFRIGINGGGYRASDLTELRWSDFFEKDGKTFKECTGIRETKTGKIKPLYTTSAIREAINEYVAEYKPDTASDDYVFVNLAGKKINRQTVDNFIKEATEACGIKGSFSTHTIGKTFAYHYYLHRKDEVGDAFALAEVQQILNHGSGLTTLRYLGIDKEQSMENMQMFANAMNNAMAF